MNNFRQQITIGIFLAAMSCAAVAGNTTQSYGVSMENNRILKGIENPRQIKVGAFASAGPNSPSIACRSMGLSVDVPSSSYESYIRDALIAELNLSGLYSDAANTELTIHFEKIDFSSTFSGNWIISAQFTIPGKSPFTVTTNYGFADVNFGMQLACANTAAAFEPAVQNFLKSLFLDPEFKQAVTDSGPKPDSGLETTKKPEVEIKTKGQTGNKDVYTELLKLDDLRKRGILNAAEFEAQKKKILNEN